MPISSAVITASSATGMSLVPAETTTITPLPQLFWEVETFEVEFFDAKVFEVELLDAELLEFELSDGGPSRRRVMARAAGW